jgi:hypothetical protein
MLNFLKIKIPSGDTKEITEIESWTVKWGVKTGWSNDTKISHKVFVNKPEAEEFEKSLKEAANLIGAWIKTELYKN